MPTELNSAVPVCCPICGEAEVERILQDLTITARGPADDKRVTGLAAFMCQVNGHVFFIRYFDLASAAPA